MNRISLFLLLSTILVSCRNAADDKASTSSPMGDSATVVQVPVDTVPKDTTVATLYRWLNNVHELKLNFEQAEYKALVPPGTDTKEFLASRTTKFTDPDNPEEPIELLNQDILLKNGKKVTLSDKWDNLEKLPSESYSLLAYDKQHETVYYLCSQSHMDWSLLAISLNTGKKIELYQTSVASGIRELRACKDLSAVVDIVSSPEEGHYITIFDMATGDKVTKRFSSSSKVEWDPQWVNCEGIVINKEDLVY